MNWLNQLLCLFFTTQCGQESADNLNPVPIAGEMASDDVQPEGVRQPEYDAQGRLVRPEDAMDWVFMGSGINLNYVETGTAPPSDMMSVTLMEPSAHRYFMEHGTFASGTMTALMFYPLASGAPPSVDGQYAGDLLGFEMSVKDPAKHGDALWGYYDFPAGAQAADAFPEATCQTCHAEHAETDLVFTQFYPRMRKPTAP